MYEVKIIDKSKKIVGISWIGKVTPDDVRQANDKLAVIMKELASEQFDVLVNMSEITVLLQDTQKEIVKHQEWLLQNGMQRAAVIVSSTIAKMQLKRTAKESEHSNEYHFQSETEALEFLRAG